MAHDMSAGEPPALGPQPMLLVNAGYFTRLAFPGNSGPIAAPMPAVRTLTTWQTPAADPGD